MAPRRTLRATPPESAASGEIIRRVQRVLFQEGCRTWSDLPRHGAHRFCAPWYNGGYRANIVAYTLAVLGDITKRRKERHRLSGHLECTEGRSGARKCHRCRVGGRERRHHQTTARHFQHFRVCKKEACWTRIQARTDAIANLLRPSSTIDLFRRMIRQRS